MTDINIIKKNTKKITFNVAKKLDTSHAHVIDSLMKTHMLSMNNGLDINSGVITHIGKSAYDGYTLKTVVETTSEKIATISTEAVVDGKKIFSFALENTANDDGKCNWEVVE